MTIPGTYSQRDPQWANIPLGNNPGAPWTIGNYGCLITCIALLSWYEGHNLTPLQVNSIIKAAGGFGAHDGILTWSKITAVSGDIIPRGALNNIIAANAFVTDPGNFVILEVTKQYFPQHFVLLVDSGRIVDPWDGQVKNFSESGYHFVSAHAYGDATPGDFTFSQTPATQTPVTRPGGTKVWVEQSQIDEWLHGPEGIDHWKVESYNKGVQLTAAQDQIKELQAHLSEQQTKPAEPEPEVEPEPSEPVNTTTEDQPVNTTKVDSSLKWIRPDHTPIALETLAVSTVKTEQEHSGALVYDFSSETPEAVELVPAGTVLPYVTYVERDGVNYFQTQHIVDNHPNLGINGLHLRYPKPPEGILQAAEKAANDGFQNTGKIMRTAVDALDRISGKKKENV